VTKPASGLPVVVALTLVALVAFAANSVLCRLALGGGAIDPASYTGIRLLAGAIALWFIVGLRGTRQISPGKSRWLPAVM
jgi:hypothetical protein